MQTGALGLSQILASGFLRIQGIVSLGGGGTLHIPAQAFGLSLLILSQMAPGTETLHLPEHKPFLVTMQSLPKTVAGVFRCQG